MFVLFPALVWGIEPEHVIQQAEMLIQSCTDENPLLMFLDNVHFVPANSRIGKHLRALPPHRWDPFVLLRQSFETHRALAMTVLREAGQFAEACMHQSGGCPDIESLQVPIERALDRFVSTGIGLGASANETIPSFRPPTTWRRLVVDSIGRVIQLSEPVLAHDADDATAIFTRVVDLALTIGKLNCALQYRMNAAGTLALYPSTDVRFVFRDTCCRRYHVLHTLLEEMRVACDGCALKVVEIGVNNALTSKFLLDRIPDLDLLGVDPFIDAEDIFLEATKVFERARLVRAASTDVAVSVADASLDFVFIDGDHSFEGVRTDIALWTPKVKPGGLMCGHDLFNPAFPGVLDAILQAKVSVVHFSMDFTYWWRV